MNRLASVLLLFLVSAGRFAQPGTKPYLLYPVVGYRFSPGAGGKFSFRAYTHLPVWALENNRLLFLPVGLSFGLNF
jgi:hypothetical protein